MGVISIEELLIIYNKHTIYKIYIKDQKKVI